MTAPDFRICLSADVEADGARIAAALKEDNRRAVNRPDRDYFAIVVENSAGMFLGGVHAYVQWDLLYIDDLWLAETARGQGLGRRLMMLAENEGIARGATLCVLDTNDWQARPFYEKLGYRVVSSFKFNQGRHEHFAMIKDVLTPNVLTGE